jgi:predicted transcriptional regulator of viral defense system
MYRLSELLRLDRRIYHTNDLAIIWGITNKNTLYTTIKRYVQKGVLIPIYKGLYSTMPLTQLNPLELGKSIIHRYTYLSTESVLVQAGVISQAIYAYTFVSDKTKSVPVGSMSFLFRKLKDEYLNNPAGVINQNGIFVATTERAAADMLYFNPSYHFDIPEHIDFDKVKVIQKEVGFPCKL